MTENIAKEHLYRLRKLLKTNPISKYKITAINQLEILVIQYSFGKINWPLNSIDLKARKQLTTSFGKKI